MKVIKTASLRFLTFRPEFETPWKSKAHQSQIALNRLTSRQVRELMETRAGRPFPDSVVERVIERTDGIPLFVEEFTRLLIEDTGEDSESYLSTSGPVDTCCADHVAGHADVAGSDRLSSGLQIVQLASVIGREFKLNVLLQASDADETDTQNELDKLVDLELLEVRGRGSRTRYSFHPRAFARMPRTTRC